ncbi:MAG TPA: tRNA (N(6)-L-threonylcarbamoyladenosine(37)-C(2))-methylthiotransferase MtaB [Chitinophagales bacterium]|nr:tRNA (N(6)-L-threonylcarbamoyladenosine(37)-C(2))-methylthiotransferase MtaB [Chitinophagales bacterium]
MHRVIAALSQAIKVVFYYLRTPMYYNRKIALHTLGCKLNFSETSAIARILTEQGFEKVEFSDRADYYIINTCSVTENADKETKQVVKNALKTNPGAKVIIVGCYAQLKPEEISKIKGVSMVLGANEKFKIHEYIEQLEEQTAPVVISGDIDNVEFYADAYSQGERTRSFLKVQDGCDYFCSFCTIPMARGKSRSNTIAHTVEVARKVAATGVKEIVLTGVNLGDYGKTTDGNERTDENFYKLALELEKIEEVERFRISSIEPNLLTNEIIEFVAQSKRFMPHFHIPLQSGSDKILKLMRRKYLTKLYRERVAKIKEVMPHACIGVDLIVGFPGETEEQFLETYNFINELDVSYLHVFTYSERANTRALNITPVVPVPERKERNKMLRILSEKKRRKFYSEHVGTERKVLFEAENDGGIRYGFTDNYIKTGIPYEEDMWNTIQTIRLNEVSDFGYVKGTKHLELSIA